MIMMIDLTEDSMLQWFFFDDYKKSQNIINF